MELEIKSKFGVTFRFWWNNGHVYVDNNSEQVYIRGSLLCEGGRLQGSVVKANTETFKEVCRKWYRDHMRRHRKYYVFES